MKKVFTLDLHKQQGTNLLLLDSQDVFKYLDENDIYENKLSQYLEKWCDWLNYYFVNSSTCNGNLDEARLRGWIDGFNFAKQVNETNYTDRYELSMRGYFITIYKPR